LPLDDCRNRRSLIGLNNFVDDLARCDANPADVGETFLAADDEDLLMTELLRHVARALDRPVRFLRVPVSWLRFGTRLVVRDAVYESLCESLQVDVSKVRRALGWAPPLSVDEELVRTAQWLLASNP
jgi:nucleoside-diphosphate-sugar epimerase